MSMMNYHLLLAIHATTVVISISLFMLRGYWLLTNSPQLQRRWTKVVPHTNDSLLLFAAIGMVVTAGLQPSVHPWIMGKIGGLLVYITLGMIALHGERSRATRIAAMIGALLVFAYLVAVAVSKQLLPGLG